MDRSSAVTIDGELFTATSTTFRGTEPQISRYFSNNGRPDVNLDTTVHLLNEPAFVSSSLDPEQQKLYFFFTEVGKEFSFVKDLRIPRVAQVCKDDVGGQRTLQKKWTSFAKAAVLCQNQDQLPFNLLQDVFTLQPPEGSSSAETRFYGVFRSQWSTQLGTAVCSFSLQDIRTVFTGPYRTLNINSHQWSPVLEHRPHLGQCGLSGVSDDELQVVKKTFLTSQNVNQVGPVLVSSEQAYTRVAAMRTLAADGRQYHVLFLLTETGFLHKVVLLDQGPHVIEEIRVFTEPQLVQSLVLSSSKGVLYVGWSGGVAAVPVARCSVYRSCWQCILARDPLCVWSRSREVCTGLDQNQEDIVQNLDLRRKEDLCKDDTGITDTEVWSRLNETVYLPCLRPSNMAVLSWTSNQSLPETVFFRSADGSLRFLVSPATVGRYVCTAEEGGVKKVVSRYVVRQSPSPRGFQKPESSSGPEDRFEQIPTVEPAAEDWVTESKDRKLITEVQLQSCSEQPKDLETTAEGEKLSAGLEDGPQEELHPDTKTYYRELVVVSLLLAVSLLVLVLGSVHIWRQKKTGFGSDRMVSPEDCSKTNTSIEICSLSAPEDRGQTNVY
ncbi:semaphorin-4A [Austrofundulus limnaeus]|uniref:Semaphorin-4A n=1 Tax=Austrofundulus limnaeus TaxID=52670 RepID=A0A2I4CCH5_AUSLI|nr:PREDICTED: semaphorin-4A-like [Austrofundulus limnaeus]